MKKRRVSFVVTGIAQPKGSAKAFVRKTKDGKPYASITSDNPRAKGWQQLVSEQAQSVVPSGRLFLGPVVLTVIFLLPRPVSLPKKTLHHTKAPDLDKLVRTIGDGLSGIVYLDDKQVVDLHARKVYTKGSQAPSARIVVEEAALPDPDELDLFADAAVFAEA